MGNTYADEPLVTVKALASVSFVECLYFQDRPCI